MNFNSAQPSRPAVRAPRFVFVDDDPVVLRGLRRLVLIERPHWEIDACESAGAAIERVASTDPDVVLTDLHMPGMDGPALLERLKLEHPHVMRVVHSSPFEASEERRVRSLAHAVLRKPVRTSDLVSTLEWALERRRAAQRAVPSRR